MLARENVYERQFLRDVVFDADAGIATEVVALNTAVVRGCMGPVSQIVGISTDRAIDMLSNAVWVLPDMRDLPDNATANPIDAQVKFLSSMAVFVLRPLAVDNSRPMTSNNVI
jgi:hypothetical protein